MFTTPVHLTALLYLILSTAQSYSSTSLHPIRYPRCRGPTVFSVLDFGATGDGVNYDTAQIQAAIDSCASSGGGRVTFPPGIYLTATLHLRPSIFLIIEKGATILGGTRIQDYHPRDWSRWYVILAENVTDVGITGGGVIDGQGLKFVLKIDPRKNVMVSWNHTGACYGDECRPRLVGFIGCHNIRVWNLTLREPAYWCLHIVRSDESWIYDLTIYGDFNTPNNDGIDMQDSNNTHIVRCKIDTGDDGICLKTYAGPLLNLTVVDCWIRTKSSAIKLGSASWFDFEGLWFDNITIVDSHRGLAVQIRDGGNVRSVTFSNMNMSTRYYESSWWGRAEPIYITTCPRDSNSKTGTISNLLFTNISADSENGIFFSGSKGGSLRDVRLKNMSLTYRRWTHFSDGLVDYRPGCGGLVSRFGTVGMMVEYVDGLVLENVKFKWCDDVGEISFLKGWNNPLEFRASTVNNLSLLNFQSGRAVSEI